jgi:hypothetical protein
MVESQLNEAEPVDQPPFTFGALLGMILLVALVLFAQRQWRNLPDRLPGPQRLAEVRFVPREAPAGMRMWAVEVADRRWGGVSALAIDQGRLLAQTDSGLVAWLPFPGQGSTARLRDLPNGPGRAEEKRNRDSESLLRANDGGWWVGFEYRHSLWHFDHAFRHGTQVRSLRRMGWSINRGVEAMLPGPPGAVRLLPELAGREIQLGAGAPRSQPIAGLEGAIADAVRTQDGRDLLLLRSINAEGITNRLAILEHGRTGLRARTIAPLPMGWLDNAEGVAAQALPGGRTRLWIVTDNDGSAFRETRLLTFVLR